MGYPRTDVSHPQPVSAVGLTRVSDHAAINHKGRPIVVIDQFLRDTEVVSEQAGNLPLVRATCATQREPGYLIVVP